MEVVPVAMPVDLKERMDQEKRIEKHKAVSGKSR